MSETVTETETEADDELRRRDCVLVTGCSSGIGRATARAFLEEEWRVYATARDAADVEDLAGDHCVVDELDVTDQSDVDRVVDRVVDEMGTVDCLVNNAGYGRFGPIEDVPVEDVHDQFEVNVYGPHRLTRAVLPHMREAEDGTIVNVSSVAGRLSFPGGGVYAGSKAALESMSDALRAEVRPFGVDVVLVQPGPVDTGFTARAEEAIDGGPHTDAYENLYDVFEDVASIGPGGPGSVPPERVARTVLQAASCTDPQTRYPVGPTATYSLYGRFVPDRWRDRLYSLIRRFG